MAFKPGDVVWSGRLNGEDNLGLLLLRKRFPQGLRENLMWSWFVTPLNNERYEAFRVKQGLSLTSPYLHSVFERGLVLWRDEEVPDPYVEMFL